MSGGANTIAGRVILITGASGGLGRAMARAFFADNPGHELWLGFRAHPENLEPLRQEFGARFHPVALDVADAGAWERALAEISARGRAPEILINNAGLHRDALLPNMPPEAWKDVLACNLDSAFYGCHAALPGMIAQRWGRILNVASLSAWLAPAGQTNYAAAKAGLIAFTRSLAKEVARLGVTVNALCPGFIETEALAGMAPEERKLALARIPMRRFGRPEEVAVAARFLASPEASYITGSVLKIDGGIL